MIEPGRRYPGLKREFVQRVCSRAGMITNGKQLAVEKIVCHTEARLAQGADEYGPTRYWHVPLVGEASERGKSLVTELQEEAADILAWGALLSIRCQAKGWTDLSTGLEVATANIIPYGDHLKQIEKQLTARLPG